jgi:hypothetical protein
MGCTSWDWDFFPCKDENGYSERQPATQGDRQLIGAVVMKAPHAVRCAKVLNRSDLNGETFREIP